MSAKNAPRDNSSKSRGARVLVFSVAAGAAATGRAAIVVNPDPNIFAIEESLVPLETSVQTFQAEISANTSEEDNELQEISLEINTINQTVQYTLQLNSEHGKSSILDPDRFLGPFHFIGALALTHAIAQGEIVDGDSDFSASTAQIEGADEAYFGFTLTPPSAARSDFDAELETPTALYGWVKLQGINSLPGASVPSHGVTVDWAYDDSGQPVIVGSTQAVPEASTLGLAATGLLLAGATAWRRRRIKPSETISHRVNPSGRWQVWEAQRARHLLGPAPTPEQLQRDWVIVAGEPQTIIGHATLRAADPARIMHIPPDETVLLEIALDPGWDQTPAAAALFDAALAQATSARQLIFTTRSERLVELATQRGFIKAARKETHHGHAAEGAALLKARYKTALAKNPVTARPIREAHLAAVRQLVAASGLLSADEVRERTPGTLLGFDPQFSFFVGEAARPAALILAFEHEGRVRLHVRLRNPDATGFPRHGMIALLITFLESVTAAGIAEVSFVTRSGASADFALLTRRWGSRSIDFLETLRLPLNKTSSLLEVAGHTITE